MAQGVQAEACADQCTLVPSPRRRAAGHAAPRLPLRGSSPLTVVSVGCAAVFMALAGVVGADCYWLVAVGRHLGGPAGALSTGRLPFASAPNTWSPVLTLAAVVLRAAAAAGPRGLLALNTLLASSALLVVATDARRGGASDRRAALSVLAVLSGGLSSLLVARVQMFSFALFPLLLLLLRAEHRRQTRRIWLAVPLMVLWANLHGIVLIGLAVLLCYLLLSRARREPWSALGVAAAAGAAVCLTPATLGTVGYYVRLLHNEALLSGSGMWSRINLGSPLDLAAVAAIVALGLCWTRHRRAGWELVAALGLAVLTASAARNGIWLLLFLAGGALQRSRREQRVLRLPALSAAVAALMVLATTAAIVRAQPMRPVPQPLVAAIRHAADGRPVLADEPVVEWLAAGGVTVLVSDPIDSFTPRDQHRYVAWLSGAPAGASLERRAAVVVTRSGTAAGRSAAGDQRLRLLIARAGWRVWVPR